MFIAMNKFQVKKGSEADFEAVWLNREVYVNREPGFVAFHMLKGPSTEEATLYISHTIWASRKAFEDWTQSESFRAGHKNAGSGDRPPLYIGGPEFQGFDVIQEIKVA